MSSTLKCLIKSIMPPIVYPAFIKYKYYKILGKKCNLSRPCTYTEKVQWAKLYRDNQTLSKYADKVAVRKYVAEMIGEEYLVPLVGDVYDSADEIDFNDLPEQFVIKANHGCGFNYIVTDKSKVDISYLRKKLNDWLDTNFSYNSLELQYKYIKPKIFIEKNLLAESNTDLPDYKFFCFNGRVYCLYVMINTYPVHKNAKLGIFDRNFNLLKYYRADFLPIEMQLEKPQQYDKMVEIAEKLAEGFSHVRVDLYNIQGRIYFGEMTFSTGSGLFKYVPDEFDLILGEQWEITKGI